MNITAPALRQANEAQLTALHERLHRLSGGAIAEMRGRYWDGHELLRAELQARGMKHIAESWLDAPLGTPMPPMRPVILIAEYLCATGSLVEPEATHCSDIDIVVRDTEDRGWAQLISEGYRRDASDPPLQFIYNPTGPTLWYVPLADLVLVERQTQMPAIQVTSNLAIASLSIPESGTIVSDTLFLHESLGGLKDALSGQASRLGIKHVRCVTKDDMPYGTPLRLALVPRARMKAINPIAEAQIDMSEPAVIEDGPVTRHELKIKILGRRRTNDGRWLYRGSIRLRGGRLQPIETRQLFEGKDEPGWEMASDRPQRRYVLGTTLPTSERIRLGAIIRVVPTYLAEWTDKGTHYGWLDACIVGLETEARQPDSQDVVERIIEATEPLWRGEPIEPLSESIATNSLMVNASEGQSFRCVVQYHALGVMTRKQLAATKAQIDQADESERARLWAQAGFEQCKRPLSEIVSMINVLEQDAIVPFIDGQLEKRMPQNIRWTQVVLRADAHTDLRIDTPDGHVIGWTLQRPSLALQRATDGELYYGVDRDKVLSEAEPNKHAIHCSPKATAPRAWLSIVTRARRRLERAPGDIGATDRMAGIYELVATGRCVYGEQREDYHEYTLKFAPHIGLSGRWVATRLADQWLLRQEEE